MIELFLEEARAEEREIKNFLDEDALIRMRPRLLSMLWAFIKAWHASGEKPSSVLSPSFEQWSNVVGGIVENAGFSSPCLPTILKTGGDTDTQDMEQLVNEMNPGCDYRFHELIALAQDQHLFQRLIQPRVRWINNKLPAWEYSSEDLLGEPSTASFFSAFPKEPGKPSDFMSRI